MTKYQVIHVLYEVLCVCNQAVPILYQVTWAYNQEICVLHQVLIQCNLHCNIIQWKLGMCFISRTIFQDKSSSYETLLNQASKTTLYNHRMQDIAILIYKALHNQSPQYIKELFKLRISNYNL